jgi:hypothetical protein
MGTRLELELDGENEEGPGGTTRSEDKADEVRRTNEAYEQG